MRLPVILVLICYFLLLISDWLIITDLRKMSLYDKFQPQNKKTGNWWKIYGVFAVIILGVLTVAVCLPKTDIHRGITTAMWLAYVVISVLLGQCIYSAFSILGYLPKILGKRRWNLGLWLGLPLGVLVFSMLWWGVLVGRNRLNTVEVTIESQKLPESFNGYKIAQISDLHVGTWGNDTAFISRLVDKVNTFKPDLIVFTGDIVNRVSDELDPFMGPLSRLEAKDGVLTILGNHDYGDYITWDTEEEKALNLQSLKNRQEKMGWKMLDNDHAVLKNEAGDSIIMIGVGNWGEPPFTQYGQLTSAYPEGRLNDGNFKVLLSHNPEHWNREVSHVSNIDLTLSGHTHAMQIMFKFGKWRWSPSQYRYEQWGGKYDRENPQGEITSVYVNIGAGEVGIPMRIGADPEITLFTLKSVK